MKKLWHSALFMIVNFMGKCVLFLNRIVHSSKLITYVLVQTYYAKLLQKSFDYNKTQGFRNTKADLLQTIQEQYFTSKYNERMLFKTYIEGSFYLAQYSETLKKSQPRNASCICGSGKKFKKCCRNKY